MRACKATPVPVKPVCSISSTTRSTRPAVPCSCFENKDGRLVPGFYAQLIIDAGPDRDAVVLPNSVVQTDQQGDFVFVVGEDSHAHRRNVSTSPLKGEEKEILSGLNAGERVVVAGADKLTDGEPVQVVASGSGG